MIRLTRGPTAGLVCLGITIWLAAAGCASQADPTAVVAPVPTFTEEPAATPTDPESRPTAVPTDEATDEAAGTSAVDSATSVPATPTRALVHQVVPGDTLFGIAFRYGLTTEELVAVNELLDPDLLSIGMELTIPAAGSVPTPTVTATGTPAPTVTPGPHEDPIAPGTVLVCPTNSRSFALDLPYDPIQLLVDSGRLLLVADGGLYALPLAEVARAALSPGARLQPDSLMPPGGRVEDIGIQELVHLTRDETTGDLILLDKSNDIYRYTPAGVWEIAYRARQIPGQYPDPQFLALEALDGVIYVLDADLGRIWQIAPGAALPTSLYAGLGAAFGVDLALTEHGGETRFRVLSRDGTITTIAAASGQTTSVRNAGVRPVRWPAQLAAVTTDSGDGFLVRVDGERRGVTLFTETFDVVENLRFRIPQMPRLRAATVTDATLYAIGGETLYVVPLPVQAADCPAVAFDDSFTAGGVDIATLFPAHSLPFPEMTLPPRPRSYPGARRLYRHGVHQGLDVYALDVPGLDMGTRVDAIAPGTVLRADHDFQEMTAAEYEAAVDQAVADHATNPDLNELFSGRQVHIEHSPITWSRYSHLDSISPAVDAGVRVAMGAPIGAVGVSGTSAGVYATYAGVHLHFEIWVNDRYLGQGLSLYETMRMWAALFGEGQD